jgi:hypothetical protein
MAVTVDEPIQRHARQKGHDKEGFPVSVVFELAGFQDVYNVRVTKSGKYAPLLFKEIKRLRVTQARNGL